MGYSPVFSKVLTSEPNEDTFVPGLDDQYSAEVFYRFLLGKRFNLTADLQYLKDPALNPTESSV